MVFDAKEKTALATSVGADERQSVQNTNNIIPTTDEHFNDSGEIYEENLQEMFFRMSHPYYLHTVSMTELYQTPYLPLLHSTPYTPLPGSKDRSSGSRLHKYLAETR